ncbi:MAG: heavy-metal-associated domain-containing protein, partial [Nitrospirae bacterium]|nr:heavy-metal-associated domain-containing protein [Nitrospirota bacterium]
MKKVSRTNLKVEGITCTGCATDAETVLKNIEGILDAKVDYLTGGITIEYDPDEIEKDRILSVVKKMGFKVIK